MTVATATENTAAATVQETSNAAQIDLAPPFWGWGEYKTPSPNGFWSAHAFGPGDGTLVNQLGRQSAGAPIGLKFTAYRKAVDFGAASIVTATFKPVSLSVIGANIQHFVYMQSGGAWADRQIYPGRTFNLALSLSGTRNLTVGCYQIHRYGSQYGEIICRVSDLNLHPLFGLQGEDDRKALALAQDDDENAAIQAALDSAETEEIPFRALTAGEAQDR